MRAQIHSAHPEAQTDLGLRYPQTDGRNHNYGGIFKAPGEICSGHMRIADDTFFFPR